MLFKIDENLPKEVALLLSDAKHDACTVLHQKMKGDPDWKIIRACRREKRILVTLDIDFADIRNYPPAEHDGIIVLRIFDQSKQNVLKIFRKIIPYFENESIQKRLWIVEENTIRIRS
jgi:predicted nuclease of predicted toxin-antitoxin system